MGHIFLLRRTVRRIAKSMECVVREFVQDGDAEDNKQDAEEAVDVDVLAEE